MKTSLHAAIVGFGVIAATSIAWAQSGSEMTSDAVRRRGPLVTAALMLSSGENAGCQTGNINDAYVVTVSASRKPSLSRYISGGGAGDCVVLPITAAVGTQLSITGVLQDIAAVPGLSRQLSTSSVSETCFNIEGFSVGLAANSESEYDPGAPANIINAQGYGFFWFDSDSDLKPGPYKYTIAGCAGRNCPTVTTYYNTDGVPSAPPNCTVLKPAPGGS